MSQESNNNEAAASEEQIVSSVEQQPEPKEEKMVPLAALEAERKKRQEIEQQNRAYQEFMLKQQEASKSAANQESDEEWVSRGEVKKERQLTKQEILEQVFVDSNPDKMQEINNYIEKIVERKPWLADTIKNAPNRYARAYEIVQDYKHLVVQQKQNAADASRIVENAKKPGSPVAIGKTSASSLADHLRSIRGTEDFRKYRQEVRQGKR